MNAALLGVYLQNFLHFDFLIFILAGINAWMYHKTLRSAQNIERVLAPKGHVLGGLEHYKGLKKEYEGPLSARGEAKLLDMRRGMTLYHSLYANITGIFPLMGLLGTVVSLIPMVQSLGNVQQGLFFQALTSTFWGIVFAIISKGFHGIIDAKVAEAEKKIETFLDRYGEEIKERTR
ncbi:hypothetical protein ABB02_00792 [Clostridiaceae bacterium JG1575]|nr:hypothetical protein ABB02_00792 [Clostridiaceae bacterium JG1575]